MLRSNFHFPSCLNKRVLEVRENNLALSFTRSFHSNRHLLEHFTFIDSVFSKYATSISTILLPMFA